LEEARREDGGSFYCPNGHSLSFGEGENTKLRRERDRLKQEQARLEEETQLAWKAEGEQRARAAKAEKRVTQQNKRAAAGTCPCCQRTFSNMATHMKQKHPEFVADTGARVVSIRKERS
jgi:hypothetical protein